MTRTIKIISAFIFILIFSSCSDTITNQYFQKEEGGNPPDVNVIYSSYSLETVHSFHMDSSAYPEYNYCVDLKLKLDKPENRSQINKMIIVNEDGFGWEFLSSELESFYSDTLGGYDMENLVYNSSTGSYSSPYYRVKLFSASNKKAEDYELIIPPDFISSFYISHGWYTQDIYQLSLDYYRYLSAKQGTVIWLNQNKQNIGQTEINSASFVDGYRLMINNVPADAYYFYVSLEGIRGDITVSLKSAPFPIEERYPSNIQILGENIYNTDVFKYIPEIQKILILDWSNSYMHILDFASFVREKLITFSNRPYCAAYSSFDNKIYVGLENGRIYSLGLEDNSPVFVKSLGSNYIYTMIIVNKYLIASTGDYNIKILDLEDNSSTSQSSSYPFNYLTFNKSLNVVYGSGGYSVMLRFNFDPDSGTVSGFSTKYVSSSDYGDMILSPDDSRLITSSGYIYSCSADEETDLTPSGVLGSTFTCGYYINSNNNIITLFRSNYSSPASVNIYSAADYQMQNSIEVFFGVPRYLIVDGDIIKIIETYNSSKLVAEVIDFSQLVSGRITLSKAFKERYYISRKLSFN